jgi:putative intracellular protease/amidase
MNKKLVFGALCLANLLPFALLGTVRAQEEPTLIKGEPKPVDGKLAPNATTVFAPPTAVRPLKVAIYQGGGSGDSGVNNVCARIDSLPNATVTRLTPEQVGTSDLSGYDAIIFSGGSGSAQAKAIGEAGRENVKKFVKNGGSYLGICAGAYLACSNYPWSLGILNAKTVSPKWARGRAFLKLQLTDEGRDMFGDVKEPFSIRYNNGPVIAPDNKPDLPPYTVRAIFKNEVAENGSPVGAMVNSPAVITSVYGKGRVLSISPHSEDSKGLENFIPIGMKWLTERSDAPAKK